MQLRPYQRDMLNKVSVAWETKKNVLAVMPTGAGKTVLFTSIMAAHQGVAYAIAHRQELVGQMSCTLAKHGVMHNIIAPHNVIKNICRLHVEDVGNCFFDPSSDKFVAGVDTLNRRGATKKASLWIMDEAHHTQKNNKWGAAVALFPGARGLGVTATPSRADGRGLGAVNDGVFDDMILGPGMRDLINSGYLSDYKIYGPVTSDLNLSHVDISKKTGDYKPGALKVEVRKSRIIGDVVDHYIKLTPRKIGVSFTTDIDTAHDVASKFNGAGVPAVALSSRTPERDRIKAIRQLRRGDLKQLVNVGLFDEGFDLPAIEVVSMCRPTQSLVLFCQQFGRALRIMEGKKHAVIIDHVGNTVQHGLPDGMREWTLDRAERASRGKSDAIPVKVCTQCTAVYERYHPQCPYCGYKALPLVRSGPEYVDGDLLELDAATLAAMRGEIVKIDISSDQIKQKMLYAGAPAIVANSAAKNHRLRQEAQSTLRDSIALWAGARRAAGKPDAESYRYFYHKFGCDVLTAQTLGRADAEKLTEKIRGEL